MAAVATRIRGPARQRLSNSAGTDRKERDCGVNARRNFENFAELTAYPSGPTVERISLGKNPGEVEKKPVPLHLSCVR
jgi:hypothetical protein